MKDYNIFYQQISKKFLKYSKLLNQLNSFVTVSIYMLYPSLLLFLFWQRGFWAIAELIIFPALGFLVVTVIRKIINQPRPYETWDILPLIKKESKGQSFPSRHVFSATLIGTVFLSVNVFLGSLILGLSLLLAFLRVVGGVHYPKDVLVGFLLGIILGLPVFYF